MKGLPLRPLMPQSLKQRIASAEELLSWVKHHKAEVRAQGGNPDVFVAGLQNLLDSLVQANTVQENWKVQLKNQTRTFTQLERQVFEATTSGIDAFSGMFGKFSNEAVQLRRIRTRMHKPRPASTA